MSTFALLTQAISNREQILLSTGVEPSNRLVARLDGEVDEPDHTFRVTLTGTEMEILDPLVAQGRTLEASFNTPSARVFFDSVPLKRERKWFKHWVLLKWPEKLTVLERRSGGREPVPDDMPIVAVLSGPTRGANLRARLFDISPTGGALLCPIHADLPEPLVGEGYLLLLTGNDQEFHLKARCRNIQRLSSSTLRAGMEFDVKKDLDPSSLARFTNMLDELEASRIRRTFRSTLSKTTFFVVP